MEIYRSIFRGCYETVNNDIIILSDEYIFLVPKGNNKNTVLFELQRLQIKEGCSISVSSFKGYNTALHYILHKTKDAVRVPSECFFIKEVIPIEEDTKEIIVEMIL